MRKEHLCYEDDCHCFVKRGPIHVDGRSQGQNKLYNAIITSKLGSTVHGNLQMSTLFFSGLLPTLQRPSSVTNQHTCLLFNSRVAVRITKKAENISTCLCVGWSSGSGIQMGADHVQAFTLSPMSVQFQVVTLGAASEHKCELFNDRLILCDSCSDTQLTQVLLQIDMRLLSQSLVAVLEVSPAMLRLKSSCQKPAQGPGKTCGGTSMGCGE